MIVAVFAALLTWIVQPPAVAELTGHPEDADSVLIRNPALGFPVVADTVGFRDNVRVTPDGMLLKVN